MAKHYNFRINLQKAEINGRMRSVVYGGPDTRYKEEYFSGTLAQAIARRSVLSSEEKRPHVAFISMRFHSDRKPPGYNNVEPLYFDGE